MATVPDISKYATVEVENLSNVPSGYMDAERWVGLEKAVKTALARPEVSSVVVSHGTDTLEETAYFLDNQINAARNVTKMHTSSVETFNSGDFGFIGYADNDRVIFYRYPVRRQHIALATDSLPYVEIVAMYGGATGSLVRAAADQGAKGIVIQALGWGNVNIPMFEAIKYAIGKGVPIVISTRVPSGRVLPVYGFAGGGKTLKDAGAIFADDLTPQKSRILLMLALQAGATDAQALQKFFDL